MYKERKYLRAGALSVLILALAGTTLINSKAEAVVLLEPQEHWKYNVDWYWKPSLHKSVGSIDSKIIIENQTADRIEGYIADANGTRLSMYGPEQIVQAKFARENDFSSDWQTAGRTHDGFFTIQIPPAYQDVKVVSIFIGGNSYYVNVDRFTQPLVLIGSARLDYTMNTTLSTAQIPTEVAASQCTYSTGSLIDMIMMQFSMLPCNKDNNAT